MKGPYMLSISAILAALFILASNAFAACTSCGGGEADWSRSADEFMNWDPTGEEPANFGINQAAAPVQPDAAARNRLAKAEDADASNGSRTISLQSINATPASVKSGETTLITAAFAPSRWDGQNPGEMQLSAQAVIRDSAGAEVERLILICSSADRYFSNWVADVPPGSYWVDILASSAEESARFDEALKLEVG
jgi:hypothetical protein